MAASGPEGHMTGPVMGIDTGMLGIAEDGLVDDILPPFESCSLDGCSGCINAQIYGEHVLEGSTNAAERRPRRGQEHDLFPFVLLLYLNCSLLPLFLSVTT